tara:strand:- start:975 stop:1937 length:963 start_codon:yes stop_codon:yes gene_type:complete
MEMLEYEYKYWNKGIKYIAGVDEAGRGPLAGPVVASCVILNPDFNIKGINDSKKLTPKKRFLLSELIKKNAVDVSIGIANEKEIDQLNILQATFLAMKRAVGNLKIPPQRLLIDGPHSNIKLIPVNNIIKGDSKSLSIAAASIIAKVERDRIMCEYNKIYSEYAFDKHKGYGTKLHVAALKEFKATPIHRKSFKIVKSHLPNFNFYKERNSFDRLGCRLVAINFIKRNYVLDEKKLLLDNGEIIDFSYVKKDKRVFVKIIVEYNIITSKQNIDVEVFFNSIKDKIKEKESKKKNWFNVILVTFMPKNKPKIISIYNEEVS